MNPPPSNVAQCTANHNLSTATLSSMQAQDQPVFSSLGVHYLMECSSCQSNMLTDKELLLKNLTEAVKKAGATIVERVIHQFNPHGLSGVIVIAESHIAVHTWPEYDYAAIDIFTCGDPNLAEKIYQNTLQFLQPKQHELKKLQRTPPQPKLAKSMPSKK